MTLDCLGQPNASVMEINLETCVRLIRALYPPHAPDVTTDPSMILANPSSNAGILHSIRVVAYHWERGGDGGGQNMVCCAAKRCPGRNGLACSPMH